MTTVTTGQELSEEVVAVHNDGENVSSERLTKAKSLPPRLYPEAVALSDDHGSHRKIVFSIKANAGILTSLGIYSKPKQQVKHAESSIGEESINLYDNWFQSLEAIALIPSTNTGALWQLIQEALNQTSNSTIKARLSQIIENLSATDYMNWTHEDGIKLKDSVARLVRVALKEASRPVKGIQTPKFHSQQHVVTPAGHGTVVDYQEEEKKYTIRLEKDQSVHALQEAELLSEGDAFLAFHRRRKRRAEQKFYQDLPALIQQDFGAPNATSHPNRQISNDSFVSAKRRKDSAMPEGLLESLAAVTSHNTSGPLDDSFASFEESLVALVSKLPPGLLAAHLLRKPEIEGSDGS